jgi:hypothetical protein
LTCGRVLASVQNAGGVTHHGGNVSSLAGYWRSLLGMVRSYPVEVVEQLRCCVGLVLALTGTCHRRIASSHSHGDTRLYLCLSLIEWFWFSPILAYVILPLLEPCSHRYLLALDSAQSPRVTLTISMNIGSAVHRAVSLRCYSWRGSRNRLPRLALILASETRRCGI